MAVPSIPQNFWVTQGNGVAFAQWGIVPGATGYVLQRSTDQINYTTVATLTTALEYKDTSVTIGTPYYYQVYATNSSGNGLPTIPQAVVPTTSGEMCLGELRTRAQQRADRLNSNFLTLPEWNSNINQSLFELYDLLIDVYEDYYLEAPAQFTTNGNSQQYPLPDGVTTYTNSFTNQTFTPRPFYKLWGVDLAAATSPTGWVTISKYVPLDRNKYFYPNTQSTIYGVFNMQYRLLGQNITFIPIPSGQQYIRLWYFPRMDMLLSDSDITTQGISGWIEYVIVDAAIKALTKEESDTTKLIADKEALRQRIMAGAKNRDAGRPDTIQDSRYSAGLGGVNGPGWTPGAGW